MMNTPNADPGPGCCGAAGGRPEPTRRADRRVPGPVFLGATALVFAAASAATVAGCAAMSAMEGMRMPGGWTLSMAWRLMPGRSWAGAAASFLGMWTVMMAAMMLPSLAPTLWRYRLAAADRAGARLDRMTLLMGGGYFLAWSLPGAVIYPAGTALAALEMGHPGLSRAVPAGAGLVVLLAGALQFTDWKARHLACCRAGGGAHRALPMTGREALSHGLRLGLHCCLCCAGPTAVLLVSGVMDLRAMAVVTAAVTLERLAPGGERVARAIGILALAAGGYLLAQALLRLFTHGIFI